MSDSQKSAKNTNTTGAKTFTDEERKAMQERALELKADKKNGLTALLAKIDEMTGSDKIIAKRIHELVTEHAPELKPKTWYGMPAYANKDGKVVCFYQAAGKFETRYATFGFSDSAKIDEGDMWTTTFGISKMTEAVEKKLTQLIKKAIQ